MPVLKTYINGSWENVSGFGNNADTLDGKHASEFASATDVEALQTKIDNIEIPEEVYVQNEEPVEAEDGTLWLDLDENSTNDFVPTDHASPDATYGLGTFENYGHVKLSLGCYWDENDNIVDRETDEIIPEDELAEYFNGKAMSLAAGLDLNDDIQSLDRDVNILYKKFTYGTSDLTAGSSDLPTGNFYFVYE